MSKLLDEALQLNMDLNDLKRQIESLTREKSKLESEVKVVEKEANKRLAEREQALEATYTAKLQEVDERDKALAKLEKDIEKRQKESLVLEGEVKAHSQKVQAFKEIEKQTQDAFVAAKDREKKADLIIKQYEKKLEELANA